MAARGAGQAARGGCRRRPAGAAAVPKKAQARADAAAHGPRRGPASAGRRKPAAPLFAGCAAGSPRAWAGPAYSAAGHGSGCKLAPGMRRSSAGQEAENCAACWDGRISCSGLANAAAPRRGGSRHGGRPMSRLEEGPGCPRSKPAGNGAGTPMESSPPAKADAGGAGAVSPRRPGGQAAGIPRRRHPGTHAWQRPARALPLELAANPRRPA